MDLVSQILPFRAGAVLASTPTVAGYVLFLHRPVPGLTARAGKG